AALSLVGIYEEAAEKFLWNEGLGLYGERRINATFADPNHFARFLLEGIVVALVLWFFVGRRAKFAFLLPAMLLAILTLAITRSPESAREAIRRRSRRTITPTRTRRSKRM